MDLKLIGFVNELPTHHQPLFLS